MNKQIQYALTTMTLLISIVLVVSCTTFTTAPEEPSLSPQVSGLSEQARESFEWELQQLEREFEELEREFQKLIDSFGIHPLLDPFQQSLEQARQSLERAIQLSKQSSQSSEQVSQSLAQVRQSLEQVPTPYEAQYYIWMSLAMIFHVAFIGASVVALSESRSHRTMLSKPSKNAVTTSSSNR